MIELSRRKKETLLKLFSCLCDFSVVALFYIFLPEKNSVPWGITFFVSTICILHGFFYLLNIIFSNDFLLSSLKIAKFSASVLCVSLISASTFQKSVLTVTALSVCFISFLLFDVRPRLHISHISIAIIPCLTISAFLLLEYYGIYTFDFDIIPKNIGTPKDIYVFLLSSFAYAFLIFVINGRLLNPIFSLIKLAFKK